MLHGLLLCSITTELLKCGTNWSMIEVSSFCWWGVVFACYSLDSRLSVRVTIVYVYKVESIVVTELYYVVMIDGVMWSLCAVL